MEATLLNAPLATNSTSHAVQAIVLQANALGWPNSYPDDITVHQRAYIEEMEESPNGVRFVWVISQYSSHIIAFGTPLSLESLEHHRRAVEFGEEKLFVYNAFAAGRRWYAASFQEAHDFLAPGDIQKFEVRTRDIVMGVPTFQELLATLPHRLRVAETTEEVRGINGEGFVEYLHNDVSLSDKVRDAYRDELETLLSYAKRAERPVVWMTGFENHGGSQWNASFGVDDYATPPTDQINFHGQNVSRSKYTGAIVVDEADMKVSTHH